MNELVIRGGPRESSCRIVGDRIAEVGGEPSADDARVLDAGKQGATRAGAVNAHTHLYSALAPLGMPAPATPPANFLQILERVWWRLDRAIDERSLRAAARLYVAEALLAGTTALVDHHESQNFIEGSLDVLANAAQELGIRLLVCYGATERNGQREEARRGLAECRRFIRGNQRPLVRGLVGLHASFTLSDESIVDAGDLARSLRVAVHVHVAEDRADVDDAVRRGFVNPLQRLIALNALPPGSILAHGVHLDEASVRTADSKGLWLVQNPRSNEGNRVGYPGALFASRRVALGTDGYPADMAAERAALERLAKENGDPCASNPGLLSARLDGAWRLLGERFDGPFGPPLGRGRIADLVVRDLAAPDAPARHVVVGGRVVVEQGELVAADIDEIRAEAETEAARLWSRMSAL
ncbi:MAG: amidohydrolase family protein [Planctomycetes bacterium]|nr:amidohydrolase family protein [Planctomycetota bacterium]